MSKEIEKTITSLECERDKILYAIQVSTEQAEALTEVLEDAELAIEMHRKLLIKPKPGFISVHSMLEGIYTDADIEMAQYERYAVSQDCQSCGGSPDEEDFGNILEFWHDDCARLALRERFDV